METPVFLAVLAAAVMHASWNAVLKIGLDRNRTVLLFAIMQSVICLPILPFVVQPPREAWAWIACSALLHAGYKIFLVQAYAHADLSQAYPLARGSAPLIVTLFSIVVLGISFDALALAAIATISAGLLTMAFKGDAAGLMRGRALFFALGTAAFTAAYTLTDGTGARIAGTPSSYVLWLFLGDTCAMLVYTLAVRGPAAFRGLAPFLPAGTLAGALSLGSYWIAVWAMTRAPIAMVAALRESSILFATLIAAFVLREHVGRWRWASALLIALGVGMMKA